MSADVETAKALSDGTDSSRVGSVASANAACECRSKKYAVIVNITRRIYADLERVDIRSVLLACYVAHFVGYFNVYLVWECT